LRPAAELLVPDRAQVKASLAVVQAQLQVLGTGRIRLAREQLLKNTEDMAESVRGLLSQSALLLKSQNQLLKALSPLATLKRGYAIVRQGNSIVRSIHGLSNDKIEVQLSDGRFGAKVEEA
jgi:exonuclease VII large subunit